jgi:hypothetical protein
VPPTHKVYIYAAVLSRKAKTTKRKCQSQA